MRPSDSSVGRASDCRSDGPWFDSGSTDFWSRRTGHTRIGYRCFGCPGFTWSYSVVVITVDFDSTDTGSNPVRTFFVWGSRSPSYYNSPFGIAFKVLLQNILSSKFARVVKGVDLRSTGRRPRGFEPHSLHLLGACRNLSLKFVAQGWKMPRTVTVQLL